MKFKIKPFLLLIMFFSLNLFGCNQNSKEIELSVNNYMPSKINQEISLSSKSNNNLKVITEYIEENKVQLRKLSSSTTVVEHWEYKDDDIYIVFTQEEFYESINALHMPPTKNELILKAPLKVGNTWTSESGFTYEITSIDYLLETYAGNYSTIEVTSTNGDMVTKNYFAPGLGIIKSKIEFSDGVFNDSELFSLQQSPYNPKDYRFYYYDVNKNKLLYTIEGVINYEPERMGAYMLKRLKEPPHGILPTLDSSVKVNNIVHIHKKDIVFIDFSKNTLDLTGMGSNVETNLLQCIVNTLGYNFDVSNVIITLDGNPYSSKYISMNQGESFKVDLTKGKELLR